MKKQVYLTLDGLRGVAALLIVTRHANLFFGPFNPIESFLAVDLFFALSGFVLTHAYQERFQRGMSVAKFMRDRLIRLGPLYLLGLVLGAVAALLAVHAGIHHETYKGIFICLVLGVLFLPAPPLYGATDLYPLNHPSWSLLFELLANLAMALLWRWLKPAVLMVVCVITGVLFTVAVVSGGTADQGFLWPTVWVGLLRVSYSFFAGILVYRCKDQVRFKISPLVSLCLVAGALLLEPAPGLRSLYELVMILVGFPLLVVGAANEEPKRGKGLYRWAGLTSYAIYVLHYPSQRILHGLILKLSGREVSDFAPWSGLVLLLLLLGAAFLLDRFFDAPLRRRLANLSSRRRGVENAIRARG